MSLTYIYYMENISNLDYMPKVKFVKVAENAKLPTKNNATDTGFDLYSTESVLIPAKGSAVVPVGITVGYIPKGYWFKIESRSGLGFKHGLMTHPGIVDSEYRGDCAVKLYNFSDVDYTVNAGDRCAQITFYLNLDIEVEWGTAEKTARGDKGLGSSGK